VLAKEKYNLRGRDLGGTDAESFPSPPRLV